MAHELPDNITSPVKTYSPPLLTQAGIQQNTLYTDGENSSGKFIFTFYAHYLKKPFPIDEFIYAQLVIFDINTVNSSTILYFY